MKLLIYTIFTFNLLTHFINANDLILNSTTTESTNNTSEATTINPNLSQNDAVPQRQYNSQRPHYKIAYNQGGATLTAFPAISKIASIKRERSSVDYNRPLDIDQTSSGLTPQLQKLLQLPITKRETTTNNERKSDEKKEATTASKTISAKHSNFGSNAYKQGGYEGSPDAQAATIKNYLGTMTRTIGKGSSRNQFGGYGTNLGSQNFNSGNDNSWRPQQEQIFPSQQQNGNYGLGGFPQHGQISSPSSSFIASSTNDGMGMNNIGQGSTTTSFNGDMNSMNFAASSNINGMSSSSSNSIFQGATNNMQNQWNGGNDFSSNINNNNGMSNIGVSQGGNNYGINTDFNSNQQGTINYGNTGEDNSGLGMNGFTGTYIGNTNTNNNNEYVSGATSYSGNNNFGTTDYSNLNSNNGLNNYGTNSNSGLSNINSQTANNYGTNVNGFSNMGSANAFGVNTVSNGDFSNINIGSNNFGINTNNGFSNNLGSTNNNNFGINSNVDYSTMNTAAPNNNFGTNNMGSSNLATNNFGNNVDYTGMNNNNLGSTDSFSSANTNYQSANNFNTNNNDNNNNNNFGTNMNNNNNAYSGNNDYTKTGIMSSMVNTENFNTNNFGVNNNNAGNSFNNFGSNSNTGNGYSSNANFGATGNSGFNVNTIPSPVGGFNNIETSMTNNNNNNGFTNSGYNSGNNDGMNSNYGTSSNNGNDFNNNNNNNAGGFSSFGNSENMPGNNFNSMNYASLSVTSSPNINGNSNGDFSSTMNTGNQVFGQQQTGYNSQSSNLNSQQGSQTFETSNPQQSFGSQPTPQNQFGYSSSSNFGQPQAQIQTPMPSQPMTQGNVGGQSVYGNPTPVNYGTYAAGVNNFQQSFTDQKNYLNIANKIAQQQALNKPDVYGSQYNSIPPQTYTPDASSVNYGTSSMYTVASPISQFGTPNPSSLVGARFSSYGSSTHSSHASPHQKANIYNVIAPIPTTSTDSKTDGTSASQPPPPPTTYKHGSNVYTTIYNAGYDPTASTSSSSPSGSVGGRAFSGTEKIGDAYSDNYGHSELINIYQTKPKSPSKE